ncbi:unnamed protein product [Alopecurus aequalis]
MRMSLLLFLLIAGATVLDAAAMPSATLIGNWQPITNITDPDVQVLGKWTVTKHTMLENDGLKFSKVVSGQMRIVDGGEDYQLDVDVLQLSGKDAMYKAIVFERDWSTTTSRKLAYFEPAN